MKTKLKKETRYTHQSSYRDYAKRVKYPLSYKEFDTFIRLLMFKINREIIVNKYEWKLPHFGGFIRISRRKETKFFFWYWDKANDYCKIKKKLLWSFRPVRGQFKDNLIGKKGLIHHYFALKNDKTQIDYDVPIISHRKIR